MGVLLYQRVCNVIRRGWYGEGEVEVGEALFLYNMCLYSSWCRRI